MSNGSAVVDWSTSLKSFRSISIYSSWNIIAGVFITSMWRSKGIHNTIMLGVLKRKYTERLPALQNLEGEALVKVND